MHLHRFALLYAVQAASYVHACCQFRSAALNAACAACAAILLLLYGRLLLTAATIRCGVAIAWTAFVMTAPALSRTTPPGKALLVAAGGVAVAGSGAAFCAVFPVDEIAEVYSMLCLFIQRAELDAQLELLALTVANVQVGGGAWRHSLNSNRLQPG